MSSEYSGNFKHNCGYRNLANYYRGMYDNVTTYDNIQQSPVTIVPNYGGTPYFPSGSAQGWYNGESVSVPNNDKISCNTWRLGQCCDGRATSSTAYSQCLNGQCPSYGNLSGNKCSARY